MLDAVAHLSLGSLLRAFWGRIALTWLLLTVETVLFALIPLLIGRAIDGLLTGDPGSFVNLLAVMAVLLLVAIARRLWDTRAYGTVRAELGRAQAARAGAAPVSVTNARVTMGRELVDFLELTAPETATAVVQMLAAVIVLLSFSPILAGAAGGAAIVMTLIYWAFSGHFFRVNGDLNDVAEGQVTALNDGSPKAVAAHFLSLRRQEVRLSDIESLVYGLIFAVLIAMLAFNLWYAATRAEATPGEIFSIVTYSLEFLQASVALPYALQNLTRLQEITARINRPADGNSPADHS